MPRSCGVSFAKPLTDLLKKKGFERSEQATVAYEMDVTAQEYMKI